MQSKIDNDSIQLYIRGQAGPQLVPKLLLKLFVREQYNSTVIPLEEGGMKEARDTKDNIIISDSTLRNILPPQINKITAWYKFMCG